MIVTEYTEFGKESKATWLRYEPKVDTHENQRRNG